MVRVRVAGAGITGLVASVELARRGVAVELWERRAESGGLLAPVAFHGLALDRGSHRVLPEALPLLREAAPDVTWETRPRRGMLVMGGRHVPYPLRVPGFLRGLGAVGTARLGWSFLQRPATLRSFTHWERERAALDEDVGFEAFVRARAGQEAYQRFYAPYARKVWGIPPSELSQTVAKQRVSTRAPWKAGGDAVFCYPVGGMAALMTSLDKQLRALGVHRIQRRFTAADADGTPTVFTGDLPALVGAPLEHRGLYLLHLRVKAARVSPVDTWYVPDEACWFGRVSELANFSPSLALEGHTVLCVEIPEGARGPQWDALEHVDTVVAQLRHARILQAGHVVADATQTYVPGVYPVMRRGWPHVWTQALEEVGALQNVFAAGRQGLFLHCNMDHCVEMAHAVAGHVLEGSGARAWNQRARQWLDLRVRD
jgi:protoporphyrinogen oxidase